MLRASRFRFKALVIGNAQRQIIHQEREAGHAQI